MSAEGSVFIYNHDMIYERQSYRDRIERAFEHAQVVALLGPRQTGKTTLARSYVREDFPGANYFDLEDPVSLQRLENPKLALETLEGLVIIDEIQRAPDIFPILRVLIDRPSADTRFLVLGSASRDLLRQSSETLAGRIAYIEIAPFSTSEVGIDKMQTLHLRGGFPPSFLANSDQVSSDWRESYIRTFLERDIPALGISIPSHTLRRFWMTLSHYHGQLINLSEIGSSFGIAHTTAQNYIDLLSGTFMVRRLTPWFENLNKRQVKRPKLYFRDSGILHKLLGITTRDELLTNPKLGFSWEGFALEEIIRASNAREEEVYFWQVHQQAELDLLIIKNGKRLGFEIKYMDAPKLTPSMQKAADLLRLDSLTVIYPGSVEIKLSEGVTAIGLAQCLSGFQDSILS